MSDSRRWPRQCGAWVVAVLAAAACAVQNTDADLESIDVPNTGGTSTAMGGTSSEMGGTTMMGTGGDMPMNGGTTSTGGAAGRAAAGTGSGKGGSAGKGAAGRNGTGGASAGTTAGGGKGGGGAGMPGTGGSVGMGGSGGKAGSGSGGSTTGGRGSGGRGSGGASMGSGGAAAGTGGSGTAGSSGMKCVTSLKPQMDSGQLGSTEVCFETTTAWMGWTVSNLQSRTLTVNGKAITPPTNGGMWPIPAADADGHRVVVFGAGMPTFTSWSYW